MKKYSILPILPVFTLVFFSGVPVQAQSDDPRGASSSYMTTLDGHFEQNPKLSDLMETLVTGPAKADLNGSTFESAKPHHAGPHEMAYQTWQEYCYRLSAPGSDPDLVKDQMKEALAGNAASNEVKVWLIKQFQWVGTEADVDALVPFLTSAEYTLRDEAIRTISAIPGSKSVEVLNAAAANADDADKQRIQDAIRQRTQDLSTAVESQFPQAIPYATTEEVDAWVKDFAKFPNEMKSMTLASLTVRGDRRYLPLALEAFKIEGEDADYFRREGILALEKLATANEVPVFLENLKFDRWLVIKIASVVEAEGFDAALTQAVEGAEPDTFSAICAILINRGVNVLAKIEARLMAADCPNRSELMETACRAASKEDVPALVDALPLFEAGQARDNAEKQIAAVCAGDSTSVLTKTRDLTLVLPLLGRIGDDDAWRIIDETLKNESMREIAVRALCNLPNAKQAEKMLAVVDGNVCSDSQKIAALRAYIRVVSLPDDQIGIRANAGQKLEMLRGAMKRATRSDEKKLVLSRLSAIRDVASARFAMEFFADPELEQDAYRALVDLAHHDNVRRPNAEFFGPALSTVIEKCTNQDLVVRAKKYRDML